MKSIMTFITNHYIIFLLLACVCVISIIGYVTQNKKSKTIKFEDNSNEQVINSSTEASTDNIING